MKYAPYSASKIGAFQSCPKAFDYRYIQKVKVPWVPSIHLTRGSLIHLFLEHHELPLKEKIQKMKEDREIMKSEFFNKELVKECLEVYERFIKTDLGKELFSLKKVGAEIGCGLNKQLKAGDYDDGEMFRGFIDRINVDTTEAKIEDNVVHVIDWKSGKDRSGGMYPQNPDQLIYYGTWYFEKFPVNTIVLHFVFVEHENAELTYTLTRDNLQKYKTLLVKNIHSIEKCEDFFKNENKLCQWCSFLEICNPSVEVFR